MSILFIHGLASCGLGDKSKALISFFGEDQVIAPDLAFTPSEAIEQLSKIIETHQPKLLIGASLGGFYATWLKQWFNIPAVLVNPVSPPFTRHKEFVGEHRRWCDGKAFQLTQDHINELLEMQRAALNATERYLVLLHTHDEVLDYRKAESYFRDKDLIIEKGGDHRFSNFADYLPQIAEWAGLTPHG